MATLTIDSTLEKRHKAIHKTIMAGEYANLQHSIDTGQCWQLEGSVGRMASNALELGACVLPAEEQHDYYGNTVPPYYVLLDGTKGTVLNSERFYYDH